MYYPIISMLRLLSLLLCTSNNYFINIPLLRIIIFDDIWFNENYGVFAVILNELHPFFYIDAKLAMIYKVLLQLVG